MLKKVGLLIILSVSLSLTTINCLCLHAHLFLLGFAVFFQDLVTHHSAIADTISCNAPCSAIGFSGKLFPRYPPSKACLWTAIGQFFLFGKKCGCSSDKVCDITENTVRQGSLVYRLGH